MAELCTLCTEATFDGQRWIIEISLSVPETCCWCPRTHTHTTASHCPPVDICRTAAPMHLAGQGSGGRVLSNNNHVIIVFIQTKHWTTVRMFQCVWKLPLLPRGWGSCCQCCSLCSMLLLYTCTWPLAYRSEIYIYCWINTLISPTSTVLNTVYTSVCSCSEARHAVLGRERANFKSKSSSVLLYHSIIYCLFSIVLVHSDENFITCWPAINAAN